MGGSGECVACRAADQLIFGTLRRRQQGELATRSGAITAAHIGSKQVGFKAAVALCLCLAPWPSLRTWSVTSHGARGPSCDGPREFREPSCRGACSPKETAFGLSRRSRN